ncbi:hypothetical protein C8J57DRAFT_1519741 [Mycena rebaudengoi]|nr:hypothetical protein C8J57DRAFT_1519741 [Mycena rebaudengoi]
MDDVAHTEPEAHDGSTDEGDAGEIESRALSSPTHSRLCIELIPSYDNLYVYGVGPRSLSGVRTSSFFEPPNHSQIIEAFSMRDYHAFEDLGWRLFDDWDSDETYQVMESGWTRVIFGDIPRRHFIHRIDGLAYKDAWHAQANHIFDCAKIPSKYSTYGFIDSLCYQLSLLEENAIPHGYLFLCPLKDLQDSFPSEFRYPACPAYWSLDPSGTERLGSEEAERLGFPSFTSWDDLVYAGIREFHEAKGFDPYSQDVAREFGYPLYEVRARETEVSGKIQNYNDEMRGGAFCEEIISHEPSVHDGTNGIQELLAPMSSKRNFDTEFVHVTSARSFQLAATGAFQGEEVTRCTLIVSATVIPHLRHCPYTISGEVPVHSQHAVQSNMRHRDSVAGTQLTCHCSTHKGQTGPYARKPPLAASLLMFVASNLQVVEQRAFNVLQPLPLGASPQSIGQKLIDIRLSLIPSAGSTCRVWVLHHNNLKVRLLLILCLLGSLASATTHMTFGALWLFGDEEFDSSGSPALNMVLPLLVTNIVATLMAYKMWQCRQQIKMQLDFPKSKKTKVEGILVILPESGVLYCLIWIPFLYMILANQGEETTSYKIVANMIPQLSVIYLVLLVSLDRTDFESTIISISTNADSDPIHFVSNTTGTGTATTGTLRMGVPIRLADASRSSDVNLAVVEETENGAAEPAIPFRG